MEPCLTRLASILPPAAVPGHPTRGSAPQKCKSLCYDGTALCVSDPWSVLNSQRGEVYNHA
jgi:hypothetical protein